MITIKLPIYSGEKMPWCALIAIVGIRKVWPPEFIENGVFHIESQPEAGGPPAQMHYPVEINHIYELNYYDPVLGKETRQIIAIEANEQQRVLDYKKATAAFKYTEIELEELKMMIANRRIVYEEINKLAREMLFAGDHRPYGRIIDILSDIAIEKMRDVAQARTTQLKKALGNKSRLIAAYNEPPGNESWR